MYCVFTRQAFRHRASSEYAYSHQSDANVLKILQHLGISPILCNILSQICGIWTINFGSTNINFPYLLTAFAEVLLLFEIHLVQQYGNHLKLAFGH